MLKILVCVKQVPDVDQMRMDPETGNLIRAGVPAILNPLDGNALAAALSVKEQYGAELSLITMGPPAAEAALRECLAAGADRAILVTDRAFGNADTLATSYSIVSAAKSIDSFDLIFCGKETLDGATGQMGAQLAERFGAAQVTSASLIKSVDDIPGLDRGRIGDPGSPTKVPRMFPPVLPEPGLIIGEGSVEGSVAKLFELAGI